MLRRVSTQRVSAATLGLDAAFLADNAFAWWQFDERLSTRAPRRR